MSKKINLGILFGGQSAEHEVSVRSARNIYEAVDKSKYNVTLIGIEKTGKWLTLPTSSQLLTGGESKNLVVSKATSDKAEEVSFIPGSGGDLLKQSGNIEKLDVIFPVLHGPMGEDGTVQGLLKLCGVPFVGSGVLGSALGMDKDVMKRLLREAGVAVSKFITAKNNKFPEYNDAVKQLGEVIFVKPANMGSSVGVSRVTNEDEYKQAIEEAFKHDNKILIEEAIPGRELEVAILGGKMPIASRVGEIVVGNSHNFYDYDAKYIDEFGAKLNIPADITPEKEREIQYVGLDVFDILETKGLARVDCFLTPAGKIYVNEINTIPGFTSISMYPKLFEASGISYSDLIDRLIKIALNI